MSTVNSWQILYVTACAFFKTFNMKWMSSTFLTVSHTTIFLWKEIDRRVIFSARVSLRFCQPVCLSVYLCRSPAHLSFRQPPPPIFFHKHCWCVIHLNNAEGTNFILNFFVHAEILFHTPPFFVKRNRQESSFLCPCLSALLSACLSVYLHRSPDHLSFRQSPFLFPTNNVGVWYT